MMVEWESHISKRLTPTQRDYIAQLYHACRAARTVEKWTTPSSPIHTTYIRQDDGSHYPLPLTLKVLSGIFTAIADRKSLLVQHGLEDEAQFIVDRYYRCQ
jgi:hypothetical protein